MPETLDGVLLPFWTIEFQKNGQPTDASAVDQFINEVKARNLSDLFLFSHGWNNDRTVALALYQRFFEEMSRILSDNNFPKKNRSATIGLAGVIWPSILWPDDAASNTTAILSGGVGGAVGVGAGGPPVAAVATPGEVREELNKVYDAGQQQTLLNELINLLEQQPKNDDAVSEFRSKMAALLASEPADTPADHKQPDYAEGAISQLSDNEWRDLLGVLASDPNLPQESTGGGAAFDHFNTLWKGAKQALRIATYWQMKQRAGIIGKEGLGANILTRLANHANKTRINLLGHSFGARLVSFSLAGLPAPRSDSPSPIKSLFLLQGALSHYAFADRLPHDLTRSGALKGMADRVDGPLLTTHSLMDLAVGISYPAASFLNRDDAAAMAMDPSLRWGAMGHDGAQAVNATGVDLLPPGATYPFKPGQWLNLDGNTIIIHGGLPSGAHSDIVHPATAWAALSAAAIV